MQLRIFLCFRNRYFLIKIPKNELGPKLKKKVYKWKNFIKEEYINGIPLYCRLKIANISFKIKILKVKHFDNFFNKKNKKKSKTCLQFWEN